MSVSAVGGPMSAVNMQAMREQLFSKLDQDQSGTISKDEFKTGPADAPKGAKSPSNIDQIFAKIDTDGNGELSKDELDSFKPARPQFSSDTIQSLLSAQSKSQDNFSLGVSSDDNSAVSSQGSVSLNQMQQQFLEQILSKYSAASASNSATLALA